MAKTINVLVFPAGEVNSVELHDALATNVNVRVFGGSSVERHGSYIYKNYIPDIPMISDDNFMEAFNEVLAANSIDVVFPTHDTVALYLAERQDQLKARLVTPDLRTVRVCRDKRLTYETFADCPFAPFEFSTPASVTEAGLPVFVKPRQGQGSVGAQKVASLQVLADLDAKSVVVTEYLPGEEFTVDCLTDRHGELRVVSPRSRDRTMAGISVASEVKELTGDIADIAQTINQRLTFRGLWYFQIKRDANGAFKLLEVSVRCAGAMCLTRARGANLPLLSVYTAMDYDIDVQLNGYHVRMDRTLISRYAINYDYDTVYLDFDDTVVVNGAVHLYAAMYLFQCKNAGKTVRLITRHAEDITASLARYGLHESLFAEVIHLAETEPKHAHIQPDRAIFVDNAYQERKQVFEAHGIPVFDVDGLEVLLDWRT